VAINVTGNDAFSYTPLASYVKQSTDGLNIHYDPGAGTTTDVEIRDATDTVVLDTFSFSNVIQLADIMSTAISANDTVRMEALSDPLDKFREKVVTVQSDVGGRMSLLQDQSTRLSLNTNVQKDNLSAVEDANMSETIMQLQKTNVTLQALQEAAAKIISRSLFDFLN
jgi:flagellar hook-associated protein 3 FlgL